MKSILMKAMAAAAAMMATAAMADPVLVYGGHSYYYAQPAGSWTDAESQAVQAGGHLVTINDASEQAALVSAFGFAEQLWIGLEDIPGNGTWSWVSGEALGYTNWQGGEPNNIGTERWTVMNWGGNQGAWNNLPVDGCCTSPLTPLRGIIEVDYVPEPSSLALVGLALFAAGAGVRRKD